MEMFQAPLRDIADRFTTSELVILGWRSQEQAYKMRLRMNRSYQPSEETEGEDRYVYGQTPTARKVKRREWADADVPAGLPDKFYDEEGGISFKNVTLKEAVQYMNAIGIKMPIPLPSKPVGSTKVVNKGEQLPTMDEVIG